MNDNLNFRERFYLRYQYRIENWLLDRFGKTDECGCMTLWGRKLRFCLKHGIENFNA